VFGSASAGVTEAIDSSSVVHPSASRKFQMFKTSAFLAAMIVAAAFSSVLFAKDPDSRLATVRNAFVEPVDPLGDDRLVAVCVADHLKTTPPLSLAGSKNEADVILRVKAHLTSGASRVLMGSMGGTPSANMEADLPDGTKLWDDGAKYRRGNGAIGLANNAECGLADGLLKSLSDAMRKARDPKK
jgi:hypothetical protein